MAGAFLYFLFDAVNGVVVLGDNISDDFLLVTNNDGSFNAEGLEQVQGEPDHFLATDGIGEFSFCGTKSG